MDRNFPLIIILVFVCVMALNGVYPVSVAVMLLAIALTFFFLSKTTGGRVGRMLLWGIPMSLVILGLFVGLLLLSDRAEWLRTVMLWPIA